MAHLVVLAAGMGTRFGGDKQLAEFGQKQLTLMEYNIAHAYRAGFREVTLIIRESISAVINQRVLPRLPKPLKVNVVFQKMSDTPIKSTMLLKRKKPLGTAHALWCARAFLKSKFCVINADDYYGASAFNSLFDATKNQIEEYLLVAFQLAKTLSEHGGVNRGICQLDDSSRLIDIVEVEDIKQSHDSYTGHYLSSGKRQIKTLEKHQLVSMNCWLFTPAIVPALELALTNLLSSKSYTDTSECYLPSVVMSQINEEKRTVRVTTTNDQWFGVTYAQDALLVDEKL